jgi:hypothetical protein
MTRARTVFEQLCGIGSCHVCNRAEQDSDWVFASGDLDEVHVCSGCHSDYVELHGEPLHETMSRCRCGPLQLIKRRVLN